MRSDSRLSRMLHVLLHMAQHTHPFTSDQISKMLDTNPVVVRRTMAGLRKAKYVRSEKGHGGGWTLACDPSKTTLLDIHRAVGGPKIFTLGNVSRNPTCGVERVVNAALDKTMNEAEALLIAKLKSVTLADLQRRFAATSGAAGRREPAARSRERA